jgi:hypothetical protein
MATKGLRGEPRPHKWRLLEKQYGALLPASVMSLIPFIITTTAWDMFSKVVAKLISASPATLQPTPHGVATAAWYMLLIAGAATLLISAVYLLGRPALPRPNLEGWVGQNEKAFHSPPLLEALRR